MKFMKYESSWLALRYVDDSLTISDDTIVRDCDDYGSGTTTLDDKTISDSTLRLTIQIKPNNIVYAGEHWFLKWVGKKEGDFYPPQILYEPQHLH